MSRTPSAHFVCESLSKRVPYTDPPFREQHKPHEISLGYGHQEISHLLDILVDEVAPASAKIKSLSLLSDLLPGRQEEAFQLHAFEILVPYLFQPNNGILLNCLNAFDKLIGTSFQASRLSDNIPRIVEIVSPSNDPSLRFAAASLLRHIAELAGPIEPFVSGSVPISLTVAASSKDSSKPFLSEMFTLLSRLANNQNARVPIIECEALLKVLVNSISDSSLQMSAMSLCSNIAMDSSHRGKSALLNVDTLDKLGPLLQSKDIDVRMSALSLIALLAVPKEGKERLSMSSDITDALRQISVNDSDLGCRKAAQKCRKFIAELPFGKVVVGEVNEKQKTPQ